MIAELSLLDVATTAPFAFATGLIVGFVLSDRWRLVRRDKEGA